MDPTVQKKASAHSLIMEENVECYCLRNCSNWNQTDRFWWFGGGDSGTGAVKVSHQQGCSLPFLKEASHSNTGDSYTLKAQITTCWSL